MSMHFSQKFPCKTCPYKATLAGNLSKHIKRVHNTIESIQCTECNKTLKASDLSYHRRFTQAKNPCLIVTHAVIKPTMNRI